MKAIALSILLVMALGLSTTAVAVPTDEPGAKEQPRKNTKAKKKTNHVRLFGRKRKESEYSRAMRRNEVLREEPAEESAKQ